MKTAFLDLANLKESRRTLLVSCLSLTGFCTSPTKTWTSTTMNRYSLAEHILEDSGESRIDNTAFWPLTTWNTMKHCWPLVYSKCCHGFWNTGGFCHHLFSFPGVTLVIPCHCMSQLIWGWSCVGRSSALITWWERCEACEAKRKRFVFFSMMFQMWTWNAMNEYIFIVSPEVMFGRFPLGSRNNAESTVKSPFLFALLFPCFSNSLICMEGFVSAKQLDEALKSPLVSWVCGLTGGSESKAGW